MNTFSIKKGEIFGLLGPNGAGKSTTFNLLTLNLKKTGGNAKIKGQELDNIDIQGLGQFMGMCPQHNTIWEFLNVD